MMSTFVLGLGELDLGQRRILVLRNLHRDDKIWLVRTTITLDQDVEAAVNRLRKERSLGLSEAVNELVRAGLNTKRAPRKFRQETHSLGIKIDVTNIPEALELLEGPGAR